MTGSPSRFMRILEIETFGRGGLIHYTYNLACALADRGHEVTLLTTAAYELEDRQLPSGLQVVKAIARTTHRQRHRWSGPMLDRARSVEALADAFRVAGIARRLRPDVIHFHSTHTSALAFLGMLRRLRIPLVSTTHVITPHEPVRYQQLLFGRIHRLSDRRIAHSEFDRRRLHQEFGVDPETVSVLPHGEYGFFERPSVEDRAEARRSFGFQESDQVVLFFGYIREYKGLDLLLEAWPQVVEAAPDARLLIGGDPGRLTATRRQELQSWATKLGAVHRFEYIPFAEVKRYFAAADLVAMPYRRISQSGVLYVALALELPIVATTVGALPEVVEDGKSALLIPPESPADLAAALSRLLADEELRRRLVEGGRKIADQHSWPAIAARTEQVFADLTRT